MPVDKTLGFGNLVRMSHKNGAPPSAVSRSPSPSPSMRTPRGIIASPEPPIYIASTIPDNDVIMPRAPALSPWDRAKLILNLASIANAIVTMVFTSFIMATAPNDRTNAVGFFIPPPAAAAALWNVAELARRVDVPGGNGLRPGAHVGVRLILCGSLVTVASMITSLGLRNARLPASHQEVGSDGAIVVGDHGQMGGAPVPWFVIAMCGVGAAIEFVLFVRACCEEDWRRKAIKRARLEEMRKVECACGIRE